MLHPDKPREFKIVHHDGRRVDADLTHQDALAYADAAAAAFGVGESRDVKFDVELAKKDVAGDVAPSKPTKKAAKKKA